MLKKIIFFLFFLILFSYENSIAQQLTKEKVLPVFLRKTPAQKQWVDSIMHTLNVKDKLAQLMMVAAYSNKDINHELEITKLIEKEGIGGLIFMQGTPEKQIHLYNTFQKKSKIPLWIGFDGEWGLNMRLDDTYKYPWNLTLGAVQDTSLIRKYGERVGQQCKRVGIQINFAPVVDINTNPENPIIGNRSFGSDRRLVAEHALAYTKGLQSQGVLACAKHFPGHGDTHEDSHKKLPVVNLPYERVNSVELYPYKYLSNSELGAVMAAHLFVPALDNAPDLPTSLSPKVITRKLKEELDFQGLVFTDALNMKGATGYAETGALELQAFLAGNDVLLFPQDVPTALNYMLTAYNENKFDIFKLDSAVRKILMAKYWAGLEQKTTIETTQLDSDLRNIQDTLLHRQLIDASITALKQGNNLPVVDLSQKIGYLPLGYDENDVFYNMLRKYAPVNKLKPNDLSKLNQYDLIIIGVYKNNANPWKSYKLTENEIRIIKETASEKDVILSLFASPYALLDIPDFDSVESIVVGYQNHPWAKALTAQKIFGALAFEGKLPVDLPYFPAYSGCHIPALSRLTYGLPEEVGLDKYKLQKIDSVANDVIAKKMAPGMQILVARHGKVVYQKNFGYFTYDKKQPVTDYDVYDLASLTKILGGLPLLMKAYEDGKYSLDETLGSFIPQAAGTNKDSVTVREALSHVGRLQAWIPYYISTLDSVTHKPLSTYYRRSPQDIYHSKVANNLYIRGDYQDSIYHKIIDTKLRSRNGYRYSDLFFTLTKKFVEDTYTKPMDYLVDSIFYKTLGTYTLTYNPLYKFHKSFIVPSEKDTYFRNQLLQGHVHDMAAAMMGGVSGHAGLFGNANDVAKMMQMYLQKGFYGGKRFFKTATIETFNRQYYADKEVRRGLGFDKPQINLDEKATCACVSSHSFGHSGFTGTYAWADPDSGLLYVFLSNRVYPTMENKKLIKANVRTEIQRIIQEAIVY